MRHEVLVVKKCAEKLIKFHFNIILPSKPTSSKWSLTFRIPHQNICMHFTPIQKGTLLPYFLTYSMEQSPFLEANWFAAIQEIPRILWNPKVHYRIHKCPKPVPVLRKPIPVPIPTSHLLEFHPNIMHPSKPRSPQWSLSLRFPHQDPIRPTLLTHTRHMRSPSHSSRFYHPQNIG